jgi:hypothetical protein
MMKRQSKMRENGSSEEESGGFVVVAQVEGTGGDGVQIESGFNDSTILESDCHAEPELQDELACGETEASRQYPVAGCRGTATLEMSENNASGLDSGALRDHVGDNPSDTT